MIHLSETPKKDTIFLQKKPKSMLHSQEAGKGPLSYPCGHPCIEN